MKTCPICEKGCLENKTTKNTVTYDNHTFEIFLYFCVCDYCGSEQSTLEQTIENKREFEYYKNLIDEMSIIREEMREFKQEKEKIKTPRGSRIHHRERLRYKRKEYYRGDFKESPEDISRMVDTPTVCSCYMCGNPRKYFLKKTLQEEINMLSYNEGLKESFKGDIDN